tara:strand:+ start:1898 stop:2809 length:912 start_codon:yes stop_codon:yes gene_type:complete
MKSKVEEGLGRIVLVDKPEGPTSHDVVLWARRTMGTGRIGHAGTLDPFASGLLLLMTGWCTRISQYLTGLPKEYDATIRLGIKTDTDDFTGTVVNQNENWNRLSRVKIIETLNGFEGIISQKPPQYSAKKINGERMYRRARRGEWTDLDPVTVKVDSISITDLNLPFIRVKICCSSGTYIRSLAREIGEALDTEAHLTGLRRLSIGKFSVGDSIGALALREGQLPSGHEQVPIRSALAHMESIDVGKDVANKLRNGVPVDITQGKYKDGEVILVSSGGKLVGIHKIDEGLMKPKKIVPVDFIR